MAADGTQTNQAPEASKKAPVPGSTSSAGRIRSTTVVGGPDITSRSNVDSPSPVDKKLSKQALAYVGPGSEQQTAKREGKKQVTPENVSLTAGTKKKLTAVAKSMRSDVELIKDERPNALLFMGSSAIILFFVCLIVWAGYSQLDSAVAVRGEIISANSNIVLQPLNGGIVREMNIRIGDVVKAGDVLITLDNTDVDADLKAAELTVKMSRAKQWRLQAQLEGRKTVDGLSPDHEIDRLELQLFETEQAQFINTVKRFDQEISHLEAGALRLETLKEQLEAEQKVAEELLLVHKDLYTKEQDAYKRDGPWRIQYLSSKQKMLASRRALTETSNEIEAMKRARQLKETEKKQYLTGVELSLSKQLQEASLKYNEASTLIRKYQQANKVVEIVAPEDGVVLALSVKGPGSVVQPAETLVELVPVDAPLEAEIYIQPNDIAHVGKDAKVAIKLDALPFTKHGEINGILRLISEDTVKEPLSGQGLLSYRGRVSLDQFDFRHLPDNFRLLPGMQLQADIKTGYQSLLSYLFFPIKRALQDSFKEQ